MRQKNWDDSLQACNSYRAIKFRDRQTQRHPFVSMGPSFHSRLCLVEVPAAAQTTVSMVDYELENTSAAVESQKLHTA